MNENSSGATNGAPKKLTINCVTWSGNKEQEMEIKEIGTVEVLDFKDNNLTITIQLENNTEMDKKYLEEDGVATLRNDDDRDLNH